MNSKEIEGKEKISKRLKIFIALSVEINSQLALKSIYPRGINIYGKRIIHRLNLWNLPNSRSRKIDPLYFFSVRCLQLWFRKAKKNLFLPDSGGNTRENLSSVNMLALARPVTSRSDWGLGHPRRAFKTFLIDWSLVSAIKKRVGVRIQLLSPLPWQFIGREISWKTIISLPSPFPPPPRLPPIVSVSCL